MKPTKRQEYVMRDFRMRIDYPYGYMEKPNLRRRHPSGVEVDYRYE